MGTCYLLPPTFLFFSYLLSFPVPDCYSTLFLFSLSMSLFLFFFAFLLWDKRIPTVARGTYAIPRMDTGGRGKFPKEARENIARKKKFICTASRIEAGDRSGGTGNNVAEY